MWLCMEQWRSFARLNSRHAGFFVFRVSEVGTPKFVERPIIAIEQGVTAEADLDAMNGMIDSMTKTVVFLSLQAETLWRNG